MVAESELASKFDFIAHRASAIAKYKEIRPLYQDFADTAKSILADILGAANIKYSSIEARAKEINKFGDKASKPSGLDSTKPKYLNPLEDITDMAGVRVITFLPQTVEDVCSLIKREFTVLGTG